MRTIDNKNHYTVDIENGADDITASCLSGKTKITTILLEDDDHLHTYFAALIVFKQQLDEIVFHAVLISGKLPVDSRKLPMDPTFIWQVMLRVMLWSTTSFMWITLSLCVI
jgi:hypothetical protein